MTEISPSEFEFEHKQQTLASTLHLNGIELPDIYAPERTEPREWLVRGETNSTRLTDPNQSIMLPNSGEMGTHGIFFADCQKPLVYPSNGIFYVYNKDIVDEWIVTPSLAYTTLYNEIASKHNLNTSKISGGLAAEEFMYKSHNIYQAKRGIATIHTPLAIDRAERIVVTENLLQGEYLSRIPGNIKDRIIPIKL